MTCCWGVGLFYSCSPTTCEFVENLFKEKCFSRFLNTTPQNRTKQKYYFPEASVLAVGQVEIG